MQLFFGEQEESDRALALLDVVGVLLLKFREESAGECAANENDKRIPAASVFLVDVSTLRFFFLRFLIPNPFDN
jgi:hypothetical protein